jgi:hypothetical protein
VLQVVHGHVITKEVKDNILQGTSMAVGEHKAITVGKVGILWVASNEIPPEDMSYRSTTHWRACISNVNIKCQYDGVAFRALNSTYLDDQNWLRE